MAENLIEQAGFADIRLADNGDLDDIRVDFLLRLRREMLDAEVQQLPRPMAVNGRDLDGVA